MTKQTITTEIDIPDGYEFTEIEHGGILHEYDEEGRKYLRAQVIIRPIWLPPSWMRPGWIIANALLTNWYWTDVIPVETGSGFFCNGEMILIHKNGKPTVGDFVPPPCDDWRQSKRRIGGAE